MASGLSEKVAFATSAKACLPLDGTGGSHCPTLANVGRMPTLLLEPPITSRNVVSADFALTRPASKLYP